MRKSRIVLASMALVLTLALLIPLVGCGGGGTGTTNTPPATTPGGATPTQTPTATKTPAATNTPTSTSTSGNTLADIYGKSGYKGDIKFDMVITSSSGAASETPQQITETVYIKGWASPNTWKWRMDMPAATAGFAMTYIYDYAAGKMYMWYPDDNVACSTSISQTTSNPGQDVEQIVPTYLGTETVDGKLCDKYQYTDQGITTTVWIWKDKSFPIKEETVSSSGTDTIEYQNIVFAPLSDSLFAVPSSVTMQPYPCYPMPSIP